MGFLDHETSWLFAFELEVWIRMENESRKSEVQSRKSIRIKKQWFVSSESESDSDDSDRIRIRKAFIGWGECEQDYIFVW